MSTRFNGFGEAVTIESEDAPWPTLYGADVAAARPAKKSPRKRRR
jgi:hypothetical protein